MSSIDIKDNDKKSEYKEYRNILEKQSIAENTFLDYEQLDQTELVCRYIMEVKNKGHFLPYEEYEIVKNWIKYSKNIDQLLIALDEVFDEINISKDPSKENNIKLKKINKKVMNKLKLLQDL